MTALRYAGRALEDLERLADCLIDESPADASATFTLIESALVVPERHPLIGRPAESGLRELVISRGRTGYLALHRHVEVRDEALVLAVRHQREAGFQA